MKKYRVSVNINMDELLAHIRNRHLEWTWPSREFYCLASAKYYAFQAKIATGQDCSIKLIDPDQYATLREKVRHILGAE